MTWVYKAIAAMALLGSAALGGCATTSPGDEYFYVSRIESEQKTVTLDGHRFWTLYAPSSGSESPSPEVAGALMAEFERRGRANGYSPVVSPADADFVVVFTPIYTTINLSRPAPVYEGGDSYVVEVEREVERYDERGRFIGYDVEHDTEYHRTPRRRVGTKTVRQEFYGPALITYVIGADEYDPEFDYNDATADDLPELSFSVSAVITGGLTFKSHGRCLIQGLWDQFPGPHPNETHMVSDLAECALPPGQARPETS